MPERALFRNWPIGLVVVAATGLALAVNHDGLHGSGGTAAYPVRLALPPAPVPNRPSMMSLTAEAAPIGTLTESAEAPASEPGENPDFSAAFAGLEVAKKNVPDSAPGGVIPLRFNLADPYAVDAATAAGPIELTKAVRVNGAEAGSATIRVTEGATIAIAGDALGRLLTQAGRGDLATTLNEAGGFISFDRLRQAGMTVRYDPVTDRILVSG